MREITVTTDPPVLVSVREGELALGTWRDICELDGPRIGSVYVSVLR